MSAFAQGLKANPASRSFTVDILLFLLVAAILMVIEARKHGVRFVWAYIVGAGVIGASVTFPLFLIARELRIAGTDPTHLRTADTIALAILAGGIAALTIWVDVL